MPIWFLFSVSAMCFLAAAILVLLVQVDSYSILWSSCSERPRSKQCIHSELVFISTNEKRNVINYHLRYPYEQTDRSLVMWLRFFLLVQRTQLVVGSAKLFYSFTNCLPNSLCSWNKGHVGSLRALL
jgi:hypothetical protein